MKVALLYPSWTGSYGLFGYFGISFLICLPIQSISSFSVFQPAVPVVWGVLDAKLIADCVNKLKALGVPISLPARGRSILI